MKMKIVRGSSLSIPVAIVLLSLPVLAIMCADASSPHILEIVDAKNGRQVFWTRIGPHESFSLEYIHSVHLSRVTDIYKIDRHHGIVLTGTVFSDHGAGVPHKPQQGGTFTILNDGTFYIKDMNRIMSEIFYRTGREYDNTFVYERRRINLSQQCGDALLIIRTRRYSIIGRIFRSFAHA